MLQTSLYSLKHIQERETAPCVFWALQFLWVFIFFMCQFGSVHAVFWWRWREWLIQGLHVAAFVNAPCLLPYVFVVFGPRRHPVLGPPHFQNLSSLFSHAVRAVFQLTRVTSGRLNLKLTPAFFATKSFPDGSRISSLLLLLLCQEGMSECGRRTGLHPPQVFCLLCVSHTQTSVFSVLFRCGITWSETDWCRSLGKIVHRDYRLYNGKKSWQC